jgi:hypothetical protein
MGIGKEWAFGHTWSYLTVQTAIDPKKLFNVGDQETIREGLGHG